MAKGIFGLLRPSIGRLENGCAKLALVAMEAVDMDNEFAGAPSCAKAVLVADDREKRDQRTAETSQSAVSFNRLSKSSETDCTTYYDARSGLRE